MNDLAPPRPSSRKAAEERRLGVGDNELLAVLIGHGTAGVSALSLAKLRSCHWPVVPMD